MQTWHDVRSNVLGMATSLTVVTPENLASPTDSALGADRPIGLMILLHGLTGNHAVWPIRTDLQTLADKHRLVLALPDGSRSFWIDQAIGLNWGTWVGKELPSQLRSTLRISELREDTFIGGLSMGGYGAFRAALDYPETFAGALSLSGTLDVAEEAFRGRHPDLYEIGFGNVEKPRPEDDLVQRINDLSTAGANGVGSLRLFAACGEGDRLLGQNHRFRDAASSVGLGLVYEEGPGVHNFRFWNRWLPQGIEQLRGSS